MFVSSITTVSINEGLDFARHLLSDAISDKGSSSPEETIKLLRALSSFIQFRYVGEALLALEELMAIGIICSDSDFSCLDKEANKLTRHIWTLP
jgi:hypothetical protein